MLNDVVDFIFKNYPTLETKTSKEDFKKFLLLFRHRTLIAQDNNNNIIGLVCYLIQKDEVHLILVVRKKELLYKALKKTIDNIMKVHKAKKIVTYRDGIKRIKEFSNEY